ncbi:hypothetical protein EXIGLDRAFT_746258, partial [Exidia glandulosa HHB12029]
MSAPNLPDGVVALLNAYVHPALVLLRGPIALDVENTGEPSPLKPYWNNHAFLDLERLPAHEREGWQRGCTQLVSRALNSGTDPDKCTAICGPYVAVVTLLGSKYVVVTTSRSAIMSAPEADGLQVSGEDPVVALPIVVPPVYRRNRTNVDALFRRDLARTTAGQLITAYPWNTTSLGPLDSWLPEFKSCVLGILDMPDSLLGNKHPHALGKPFREVHSEIWQDLEGDVKEALAGHSIHRKNQLRFVRHSSVTVPEEFYYTRTYIPWRTNGRILGTVSQSTETTAEVLASRRLSTLEDMQLRTVSTSTVSEFFAATLDALEVNTLDLPFVLVYSVKPEYKKKKRSQGLGLGEKEGGLDHEPTRYHLSLVGSLGVPDGHMSAQPEVLIRSDGVEDYMSSVESSSTTDDDPFSFWPPTQSSTPLAHDTSSWPFLEILAARGSLVTILPLGSRANGFLQRGWDYPCTQAVAFAIGATGKDQPAGGLVIIGLNPCRPYDADYANFVRMLSRQMTTGLTTAIDCAHQLQRAEELASIDRAKTTFFSNVSHELRTPLTLIIGPVEDILRETIPAEVRTRLDVVLRNASRLHRLVNTILDFSRLKAGHVAKLVPVDLGALTANFASLFRSAIERARVKYSVACDEGPLVYLDPDSWEKIITNIISNAFKYCLKGKIEVRVHFTRKEAIFSCSDTGCGIPEKELENIFTRFHRVACTARSHEGTGIGLALAQETVIALGGRIKVASVDGQGSTFTVTLPLGTAHIPPELLDTTAEPIRGVARGLQRYGARMVQEAAEWTVNERPLLTSSARSFDGLSAGTSETAFEVGYTPDKREPVVVVADDNADLRLYCTMLLSSKYNVHTFADGQAALDYVQKHDVDLILSDVEMPRMDGYEFLAAVREDARLNLLSFILVSAHAGSEARVVGLNAGADDYLVKPFSSKALMARVQTHIELGQGRRGALSDVSNSKEEATYDLLELEARVQDRTKLLIEIESQLRLKVAEEQHMRKQQEIVVDLTSHELRNPLNATWQNAEFVEDMLERLRPLIPEEGIADLNEAQSAIESIALSVAHQTRIADDILNFSKISMQMMTIHTTPFPVCPTLEFCSQASLTLAMQIFDIIQDVCRLWEIETRERDIDLELVAGSGVNGSWIISDPQRISQVTINFLLNALRFTSECLLRHITVTVRFLTRVGPPRKNTYRVAGEKVHYRDACWLQIAVQDTGPGLSVEDLKKLFERFAQAHPSKDQFTGGHGLGLFVSRHLVSLLDGFIEVESVSGQGATFSFCIPVEQTEPQVGGVQGWRNRILGRSARRAQISPRPTLKVRVVQSSPSVASPTSSHWLPTDAPAQKVISPLRDVEAAPTDDFFIHTDVHVLVVEDNIINRKILVRQLQGRGFRTSSAVHGQAAVDILLHPTMPHDVDVVLMDIEMPVKDGKTACSEVRAWEAAKGPGHHRLPVIAVTGNARDEQVGECLAIGFDEVALKPYRIDDIVRLIGVVRARFQLPSLDGDGVDPSESVDELVAWAVTCTITDLASKLVRHGQSFLIYPAAFYPEMRTGASQRRVPAECHDDVRAEIVSPELFELPYEIVQLCCSDGVTIEACVMVQHPPRPAPTIFMFHGNGANYSMQLPLARNFYRKMQCNVFMLSYR